MNADFFNKLPAEALKVVVVAYKHQPNGWTDQNYKANYLAFLKLMGDEDYSASKFDEVVCRFGRTAHIAINKKARSKARRTIFNIENRASGVKQSPAITAKDCVEMVGRQFGAMWL